MSLQIEAVYENGVLRPDQPLPFHDKERVTITIEAKGSSGVGSYGVIGWTGEPRVVDEIALDPEMDLEESP